MEFQGKHVETRQHTNKNKRGGFQADSLNTVGGYTYAFFLRNQPPPQEYIDQGLCPLHARTLALLSTLTLKWHTIYMDNLYISTKFLQITYLMLHVCVTWVCCQCGCGVPALVKQVELFKQDEATNAGGTLKVVMLCGDPQVPNLICTSLYDQKPFYMMSRVCLEAWWSNLHKYVFDKYSQKKIKIVFYSLNLVDEHNS